MRILKVSLLALGTLFLTVPYSLARPEGSIDVGPTQGLDQYTMVRVDVIAPGETIVFCSSDDGLREPPIDGVPIDADPVTPDGGARSGNARPPGRTNAEVLVYPPETTPCLSDVDCVLPEPGHVYRCFDRTTGIAVFMPAPDEPGECAYVFEVNPTSDFGLGACYWDGENAIWSEVPNPGAAAAMPRPHRLTANTSGVWSFDFCGEQETLTNFQRPLHSTRYFQIDVEDPQGQTAPAGRVHTDQWILNGHQRGNTSSATFYAVKRVGGFAEVFALELLGMDGFLYSVLSNRTGIDGRPDASWCEYGEPAPVMLGGAFRCPAEGDLYQTRREHRLYLNYPEVVADRPPPLLTNDALFNDEAGTASISPDGDGVQDTGQFTFVTNLPVSYRLVVDTSRDNVFQPNLDLVLRGTGGAGEQTIAFDGLDPRNGNTPLPPGAYRFRIEVTTAETHFPLPDIEANDLGFIVSHRRGPDPEERTITPMFWNDTSVRNPADLVDPDDALETLANGSTIDPQAGEPQRRRWVQPEFLLNDALVSPSVIFDTWVFGERQIVSSVGCRRCAEETGVIVIGNENESPDPDGDGLGDDEEAILGTDPNNPDTDGDGLDDRMEAEGPTDPLRPDSDGDGLDDGVEDANRNGVVDDGETDPLNPDTDGDGLMDGQEDADGNGRRDANESDPLNPDTDGDGIPDGDDPRPLSPEAEPEVDQGVVELPPDADAPMVSDAGSGPRVVGDGGLDRTRLSDFEVLGCDCSTEGNSPGLSWWFLIGLLGFWRRRCTNV